MTPIIDWTAIRQAYVTGTMGLRELSKTMGVSKTSICRVSTRDNWVQEREAYRERVAKRASANVEIQDARTAADRLMALKTAADKASDQVVRKLTDVGADGELSATDVRALTAALKDLVSVVRNLNDIPALQEREALRMAGERLKLEQRRADEDKSTSVTVKFEGEAAQWAE